VKDLLFLHPERWPVLFAPLLILWLVWLVGRRRQAALRAWADVGAHPLLLADAGPRGRRRRAALEVLGLGLLALATLEPSLGWTMVQVERRGVVVVICLDTSRSMNAQDLAPSRLERAKRDIKTLLPELVGDRLALVAFAGDAKTICPLTHDYGAFEALLRDLDDKATRRGGTNLGGALRAALVLLPADAEKTQCIMLLTDGEDLAGQGRAEAESARHRGVRVHAIGYGSAEGAKIPGDGDEGFLKDETGQDVVSRMDAEGLREVTRLTDGAYLMAAASPLPVLELYQKRIRPMEQRRFEAETRKRPHSRFQWMLIPGFLFLLLAFIDRGRMRRGVATEGGAA
jgi:Ca-activated chloride channel family protein